LEPFLPAPVVIKNGDSFTLENDRPDSIGRVKGYHGNFGVLVRALAYIATMGAEGLERASELAVLNANYIRARLNDHYHLRYTGDTMHEVVFDDKLQKDETGITTMDIAKRLIDYGFHPMTVYFPLIVPGAMMIEPTESESKESLDAFCDAMISIAAEAKSNPQEVKQAPHLSRIRRLDEVQANRQPVLRWKPRED
jgi:glycine dehydrogenase subunit 2